MTCSSLYNSDTQITALFFNPQMETLYRKLYEKYSKLKDAKYLQLDEINKDQEVKFMELVSASDSLIEYLTTENKKLCEKIDELQTEGCSLRTAKDQQFDDLQEQLMGEKQKNQQLSAEIEQLRNLQREGLCCSNRSEQHEDQPANNIRRNPHVSGEHFSESPRRMTRKRARLSLETDPAVSSPSNDSVPGQLVISTGKRSSRDHSMRDVSNEHAQPECCRSNVNSAGPCKCLFQNLAECLIGMKISIVDQPEGTCIRAVHQSSGYSFSLTWLDKAAQGEAELLYNVSSLGTFTTVAPEWMREVIIFSMSMCPVFFERVSRVIKQR